MVKLVTDTNLTASVNAAVAALVAGAPGALDTLNELATALGDDANFAATVTAALGNRLTWRGAWAPATNYVTNDVVTFNGGLYRAPNNFTSAGAFVLANWVELHAQTGTYALPKGPISTPHLPLAAGPGSLVKASAVSNQRASYLAVANDGPYYGPGGPGVCVLNSSQHLLVYRKSTAHSGTKASLYGRVVTNLATASPTFGTEFLIYGDATYDCRDACVVTLEDGRICLTFFLEDPATSLVLAGNGCRLLVLASGADPTVQNNWVGTAAQTPVTIPDSYNQRSASSGPAFFKPGGTTLYFLAYGRNSGDIYDQVKLISAPLSNLTTWTAVGIIGDGVFYARNLGESCGIWSPESGHFVVKMRCTDDENIYQTTSTTAAAGSWSKPATAPEMLAHPGNSSPRMTRFADSGKIVTLVRGSTASHGSRTLAVTSIDGAVTWLRPRVLDTITADCEYGTMVEVLPGLMAAFYITGISTSEADIRLRYIADQAAITPNGVVLARGVTAEDGDIEAYSDAQLAHYAHADGRKPTWTTEKYTDGSTNRTRVRMYDPITAALLADLTKDGFVTLGGNAVTQVNDHQWEKLLVPLVQKPASTAIGVWTPVQSASTFMGGYRGSDGTQNAEAVWNLVLGAGTWDILINHVTAASFGIMSVQIDGVEVGTVDMYTAGTVNTASTTLTGIAIANANNSAKHAVKFKMTTKNASSTGYTGRLVAVAFQRTA